MIVLSVVVPLGVGKCLTKGSMKLWDQVRDERETPTSEEEMELDRPGDSGNSSSGEEEEEEVEVAVTSTSANRPAPKSRLKPNNIARKGHPEDSRFRTVSVIPPKEMIKDNEGSASLFWEELVTEGDRDSLIQEVLELIPPSANDKAHDHEKGMCIYWKILKCGFQLAHPPLRGGFSRCSTSLPRS